jgi:ribonuclease PH
LQKTVLAIQQKIKHVIIILTDSNPELNNNRSQARKQRDPINPSKTPKHTDTHTSLSKRWKNGTTTTTTTTSPSTQKKKKKKPNERGWILAAY